MTFRPAGVLARSAGKGWRGPCSWWLSVWHIHQSSRTRGPRWTAPDLHRLSNTQLGAVDGVRRVGHPSCPDFRHVAGNSLSAHPGIPGSHHLRGRVEKPAEIS